jgi:hypothetical protein
MVSVVLLVTTDHAQAIVTEMEDATEMQHVNVTLAILVMIAHSSVVLWV